MRQLKGICPGLLIGKSDILNLMRFLDKINDKF